MPSDTPLAVADSFTDALAALRTTTGVPLGETALLLASGAGAGSRCRAARAAGVGAAVVCGAGVAPEDVESAASAFCEDEGSARGY